jgi:hypothetical protein
MCAEEKRKRMPNSLGAAPEKKDAGDKQIDSI